MYVVNNEIVDLLCVLFLHISVIIIIFLNAGYPLNWYCELQPAVWKTLHSNFRIWVLIPTVHKSQCRWVLDISIKIKIKLLGCYTRE